MLKVTTVLLCFTTTFCVAAQPQSNVLQVEYKKNIKEQRNVSSFNIDFNSVSQLHEATYQYLDGVFTSFYHKITFNRSISDSTFKANSHYELFSIPLIAPNEQGIQLELYANFSNPSTQYLSNLSTDHALYDYISRSERFDLYDSELSVGAGMSFYTSQSSQIKFILSNGKMPGYGGSTALFGFETHF